METLDILRTQIDAVDDEILKLVAKRVELAREVGRVKEQACIRVLDPTRELQVVRRWTLAIPADSGDVARLAQAVISLCRRVQ